jgi:hypothetical protein
MARALCVEDSLQAELVFLRDIFKQTAGKSEKHSTTVSFRSVAFLPFVGTIFNRISRVLARHNIKSVSLPHMKLSSLL